MKAKYKDPRIEKMVKPLRDADAKAEARYKAAKKPDKTITVKLKDLVNICHACGKVKTDVYERTYRSANYKGPCGDSFCYASCDMSACKETRARVCGTCAKAGKVPPS